MKAILEFDLPEDNEEFNLAVKASAMSVVIWGINSKLREIIKYDETISDETYKKVEEIRSHLFELINENGINNLIF
jgi:hypothetical protein